LLREAAAAEAGSRRAWPPLPEHDRPRLLPEPSALARLLTGAARLSSPMRDTAAPVAATGMPTRAQREAGLRGGVTLS